VWSCYAPDYDQASGIFGRAVQLGVPAIVRTSSYLAKLADHIGHPVLPVSFGDADKAAERISRFPFAERHRGRAGTEDMRRHSLLVLTNALGLPEERP
jgi:hypothetical protein